MKDKFLDFFMGVAIDAASLSYAKRRKVGCVIVKDRNILSFGYNGTPEGHDNCCEEKLYYDWDSDALLKDFQYADEDGCYRLVTKAEVSHAEENCAYKILTSNVSSEGSIVFLTLAPCIRCAKLLVGMKIDRLYYLDDYSDMSGVEYLIKCGVEVIKYDALPMK